HSEIVKMIEVNALVSEKVNNQFEDYKKAVVLEQEAIKTPQKSLYSDEVAKADSERDNLYRGLKNAINAYGAIPNEDIKQAYRVLSQLVKEYNIKTTMQLDQATGLLIRFIDDLENKYSSEVKKLSLNNFVTLLKEANERLRTAVSNRNAERSGSQKPAGALKQARIVTDNAYKIVIKYINAYALIEGAENYNSFINQINGLIDRYKVQVIKGRGQGTNTKNTENPSDDKLTE
ncbi:DUF6261 family protein, partial [Capnocytophaga sp.]|uniref:DUF6261 family protein n=1 Tax=Capnocytophaga sp. TaxID=44737 RepID=UPI0026DBDAD4